MNQVRIVGPEHFSLQLCSCWLARNEFSYLGSFEGVGRSLIFSTFRLPGQRWQSFLSNREKLICVERLPGLCLCPSTIELVEFLITLGIKDIIANSTSKASEPGKE